MTDKYKIDSHKINYHVDKIHAWMEGDVVYPVYVEITPSGACNHRCTFCAVDYIGYKTRFLEPEMLKKRITEMGLKGVRSIMYAGEGEPLLHKDLASIIRHTKETAGIDVSITTNAVALTEKFAREALPWTTWIKASVNAGTAEDYAKIHRTNAKDFERVMENLARAVKIRDEVGSSCALGAQMVLLPENALGAIQLARRGKAMGLDYVVIKPYSQHNRSITHEYDGMKYDDYMTMADELEALNDGRFDVVFRRATMSKLKEETPYTKCYSTPYFWAYIMGNGDVYGCSAYLEDARFCYGNIHDNTFEEIWEGEKRKQCADYVKHDLDITECRKNCRMDEVNRYLWDLKHPPAHVNFI
jgi:radical SAM protein with 4Fe4S-binding SPASM domain